MLTTNTLLLEGLREGRDAAWSEFDGRYRPVLQAFGRRLGLGPADAADGAQEALAAFALEYRKGGYRREKGRLRSWLFGIARRRILRLREQGRRRAGQRGESVLSQLKDQGGWEDIWEDEWRQALLRQAVLELRATSKTDPRTLQAFEQTTLQEKAPADVARDLGMSLNAVYLARHRTMQRLREILQRLEEEW